MTTRNSDRNLLFGILALQMDFISREALVKAMNDWVLEKDRKLGDILVDSDALSKKHCDVLELMVDAHVEAHSGDAGRSLAAISAVGSVADELENVNDVDVQASMTYVSVSTGVGASIDETVSHRHPTNSVGDQPSLNSRYRIVRPHAEGGLGKVSVAMDRELNREVALKEIKASLAHDESARSRFTLEAEITGGLEHPGIVPVYGLGHRDDGQPFYAMRFIKGDSLKEACAKYHEGKGQRSASENSIQFRKLLGRFVDVCNAIEYAHSRGVLHRDLKPGNVMLGKYGETLVVDWGLAKPIGRDETANEVDEQTLRPNASENTPATQLGTAIGTPQFMSPEQAAGKLNELGPSADVYSLGATLYYLLVNGPPIKDRNIDVVLAKVQSGQIKTPVEEDSTVPLALQAICLKAMRVDPRDRYESVKLLADEVENWLADESVQAYEEPGLEKAKRWMRSHPKVTASAFASIFVGGIAALCTLLVVAGKNHSLSEALASELAAREEATKQEQEAKRLAIVAEKEKEAAVENEQVANERLQLAIDAVEQLLESGSRAMRVGTTTDAMELFSESITILESLLQTQPDDVSLNLSLATAQLDLCWAMNQSGNYDESLELSQRSVELLERFRAELGDEEAILVNLAKGYNFVGNFTEDLGRFQDALRIYRQLVQDYPDNSDYENEVSRLLMNVAYCYRIREQYQESQSAYQESIEISGALVDEHPESSVYKEQLSGSIYNYATLLFLMNEPLQGREMFERSIELREEIVRDNPNDVEYADKLARSNYNLFYNLSYDADETLQISDAEAALIAINNAREIWSDLQERNPDRPKFAQWYKYSLLQQIRLHAHRDDIASINNLLDDYEAIVQTDAGPGIAFVEQRLFQSAIWDLVDQHDFEPGNRACEIAIASLNLRRQNEENNSNLRQHLNHFNNILWKMGASGRTEESIALSQKLLTIAESHPDFARELLFLKNTNAVAWARSGDYEKAAEDFLTVYTQGLELESREAREEVFVVGALINRARTLTYLHRYHESIRLANDSLEQLERVVRESPEIESYALANRSQALMILSAASLRVNRLSDGMQFFADSCRANPNDHEPYEIAAWELATSLHPTIRNGSDAVELATTLCERTNWEDPHHLNILAAAYAELGDFQSATEWIHKAIARVSSDTEERSRFESMRELYLDSKPFIQPTAGIETPMQNSNAPRPSSVPSTRE